MVTQSEPQWKSALDRANTIRLARADLKRRIYRGTCDLARIFDPDTPTDDDEIAAEMTVGTLLTAQLRWGERRARKVLIAGFDEPPSAPGLPAEVDLSVAVKDMKDSRLARLAWMLRRKR